MVQRKAPHEKYRNLSTTLPPEIDDALYEIAQRNHAAPAAIARAAIIEYVRKHAPDSTAPTSTRKRARTPKREGRSSSNVIDLDSKLARLESELEAIRRWREYPPYKDGDRISRTPLRVANG